MLNIENITQTANEVKDIKLTIKVIQENLNSVKRSF